MKVSRCVKAIRWLNWTLPAWGQVLAERAQAMAVLTELRAGPRQETIEVARTEVSRLGAELILQESQLHRRERLVKKGAAAQDELERFAYNFQATNARRSLVLNEAFGT